MITIKRQFGDTGENIAEEFLKNNEYKIMDRNYRVKNLGEIDIVANKGGNLIFFEVKTRLVTHETDFPIETSINTKKRRNLRRTCEIYLRDINYPTNKDWQIDGIFIKVNPKTGKTSLEHLENIIWEHDY